MTAIRAFRGLMLLVLLAGCASGPSGLSSLGRDAQLTALRAQDEATMRLDDGECERWTRATKGKDEPLPSADLRYAACVVARGYSATVEYATISSPTDRSLETVLAELRACRADKIEMSAESYLVPFKGYADGFNRDRALECLTTRGYIVADRPPMVRQPDAMRSTR